MRACGPLRRARLGGSPSSGRPARGARTCSDVRARPAPPRAAVRACSVRAARSARRTRCCSARRISRVPIASAARSVVVSAGSSCSCRAASRSVVVVVIGSSSRVLVLTRSVRPGSGVRTWCRGTALRARRRGCAGRAPRGPSAPRDAEPTEDQRDAESEREAVGGRELGQVAVAQSRVECLVAVAGPGRGHACSSSVCRRARARRRPTSDGGRDARIGRERPTMSGG